jgi:hypothetical protein
MRIMGAHCPNGSRESLGLPFDRLGDPFFTLTLINHVTDAITGCHESFSS